MWPVALVASALLLAALAASVARGEPSTDSDQARQTNEQISGKKHEDTRYWTQVGGAPHPEQTVIEGSPTSYDADLFAVRFQNGHQGFAAGSACAEPATPAQADSCERVPVIYGTANGRDWSEDRFDRPGYVGAIAWINNKTALALGGSGTYPRREPNPPGDEWDYDKRVAYDQEHGAGKARAWLYEKKNGSWREITNELPQGMRGLSALDVWIGREADGSEWGIAGGYGQLWEWRGGEFTGKRLDKDSPITGQGGDPQWSVVKGNTSGISTTSGSSSGSVNPNAGTSDPALFQYRVREIRIAPDRTQKRAFAFTAGCCGPASAGGSRRIEYVPKPRKDETGVPANEAPPRDQRPRWVVRSEDYGDSVYSFALRPGPFYNPYDGSCCFFGDTDKYGEPQPKYHSPTWNVGTTVVAPGGPEAGDSSQSPRYIASDGDTEPTQIIANTPVTVTGNGLPDWKVGASRSVDPAVDGLGLLQTTVTALRSEYGGVRPHCSGPTNATNGVDELSSPNGQTRVCRSEQIQADPTNPPTLDEEGPLRTRESGIQPGPSWALNAIDMPDAEGAGYAVGDRGAILYLAAPPAAESDPPPVGQRRPAPLGERSPYETHRPPPAGEVDAVPPIAAQPRQKLPEPRLYRAGSPDASGAQRNPPEDVHTIVMSRDGSEGWAIGPSPEAGAKAVMTLYRYDGARWTRCDPVGTQFTAPDRACAELAPLYLHNKESGARIRLTAAARVPLENDADPSNDGELEIVAAGTVAPDGHPTVIRYRDGRWRLEDLAVRRTLNPDVGGAVDLLPLQLAFTSPNEGWMVSRGSTTNFISPILKRFDGKRWIDCATRQLGPGETLQGQATGPLANREACGDTDDRLAALNRNGKISLATAGGRVYLAATRPRLKNARRGGALDTPIDTVDQSLATNTLMILYKDAGQGEQWRAEGGGYDPGSDDPNALSGSLASIAVARREDGGYEGWATGTFGRSAGVDKTFGSALLRLAPGSSEWRPWQVNDAAGDYLTESLPGIHASGGEAMRVNPPRQLTLPGSGAKPGRAFLAWPEGQGGEQPHALTFSPERRRWEVLEKPSTGALFSSQYAHPIAFAPDGRGGAWAAYKTGDDTYFYDYTDTPPREVFSEVANPIAGASERPTALAGAPDGTLWLATNSEALYRYDRLIGWEKTQIPGWDPGRVVTRRSRVNAIAVGPDGAGLAVGEGGKIADVSPSQVRLDAAAGTVCRKGTPAPCGTSFDLRAVALAPGGSALAGGELRKIAPPGASAAATITAIAMPSPDRAWLTLDSGQVFAGSGDGQSNWSWEVENTVEIANQDRLLSEDLDFQPIALRAIAIDESGHGYAVGDRGLVLERTGDGDQPWRRVDVGVSEELTSVALPAGEGEGALIGGTHGLILTRSGGEWHIARAGDQLRPDNGNAVGLALLPGSEAGQAEAWSAVAPQRSGGSEASQLFHYASDASDPLLDAGDTGARAAALRDVPAPRPGEISFAAFGRSDCHQPDDRFPCPALQNTTDLHETVLRRARDEILARSGQPGGPDFAIHTGDAYDTAGPNGIEAVEQNSRPAAQAALLASSAVIVPQWTGGFKFRRLNEQLLDPLADRGLPLFGAIGSRDLSETRQCAVDPVLTGQYACAENRDKARVGENLAWRQAMAEKPAPWGDSRPAASDQVAFKPLRGSRLAVRSEDQKVDDPSDEAPAVEQPPLDDPSDKIPYTDLPDDPVPLLPGSFLNPLIPDEVGGKKQIGDVEGRRIESGEQLGDRAVPVGGASTHYAADLVRDGEPVARLIVVDTSLGSLAASDGIQQPVEPDGQAAWLERMLCIRGQTVGATGRCTRRPGQQAIVVSSTPTYSYGPTSPAETQADGAAFESILLRHRASVVVSGRLGWNGRYWATAPGVHEPCPGEGYRTDSQAPEPGTRVCGREAASTGAAGEATGEAQRTALEAAGAVGGAGVPPFVVASGAGGRFDELAERSGRASAENGFWRGYTIVRLDPSGDPRRTVVEQRPVLDWIGIAGREHVLRAGQKLTLRGGGREPIGAGDGGRFVEISSPAITHRYDLVWADQERPWVPLLSRDASEEQLAAASRLGRPDASAAEALGLALEEANPCHPYVCLDPAIGTMIDRQSGRVKAGRGNHPRAFAIALLSVGDKVATYPLAFEPRRSFRLKPAQLLPSLPLPKVAASAAAAIQSPPQPPTPNPPTPQVNLPVPPPIPGLPTPTANPPAPPAPPAPPPPPVSPSATPLDLVTTPVGLNVAPQATVIPPPAPPIQPAPPGGARREARQRQAATQKSGADGGEGSEIQELGGDMAEGRLGTGQQGMSRRDRERPAPSITAVTHASQPSAWSRGALYAGSLTLASLLLATAYLTLRPRPRRNPTTTPAPAYLKTPESHR